NLGTVLGHDGAPGRAALVQAANELEALICGDAAADDQEDALALHVSFLNHGLMLRSGPRGPPLEAWASPFETARSALLRVRKLAPDVSHRTSPNSSRAMTMK